MFSSVAMIATILLTAMFTAGVIDRILGPRLVGLLGPRVLPHSDHVIVVGLGQVGVRLCRELLALGVPVVGVERDRGAKHLRLVWALRIPVVLGDGTDRRLLEKLRVHRARALAAVGSDDLDNIAGPRGRGHRPVLPVDHPHGGPSRRSNSMKPGPSPALLDHQLAMLNDTVSNLSLVLANWGCQH